ncbi:MAG TPA: HAMP domain-containing sensor histidine kinase [Bacillota bacterium]|nr:HAMP domain-containing sensor histidine kinase [Bacillota bacterium]
MNRLQTNILIYFLVVAVVVILVLGSIHALLMNRLFDRYVEQSVGESLLNTKALFESYYERNGSFAGVELLFRGRGMMGAAFILADADRTVLIGPQTLMGPQLPLAEVERGLPITVRSVRVGTLISSAIEQRVEGVRSLEQEFRSSFNLGSMWTGALALLVAFVLGVGISRKLISPIIEIDKAAATLGAGRLDFRIPAKYREVELASLVASFNEMAARLEKYEKSRRNLVADVAHELRTPLTILRASLESMLAGVTSPDPEQIASLYDEASRIGRLVEDLQELSLAEAGRLNLKMQPCYLNSELSRVVEHIRPVAEDNGVHVTYLVEAEQTMAHVDPDRLRQVLFNLIYNAIQYNRDQGKVDVRLFIDNQRAVIRVSDTGHGITVDELPHVFDRFYRGDKARQRTGTGLGLAIAKEFTESMQGRIEVESVVGIGSTFTLSFPLLEANR